MLDYWSTFMYNVQQWKGRPFCIIYIRGTEGGHGSKELFMAAFTVNGKPVSVEKNTKLIRFLRDELRLTSVKDGCSEGACGTCTVLIDGKPTRA